MPLVQYRLKIREGSRQVRSELPVWCFVISLRPSEHVSGAWAADFPLIAQAYFCDTRSPLRSRSAALPLPLSSRSPDFPPAPLQSHALNILFICIHRRPKHNSRKKTEQHNVTKLKKEQQSKQSINSLITEMSKRTSTCEKHKAVKYTLVKWACL